jgi:hypothetical protein
LVKADLFPPYLLPIALTFTLPPEGVLKVTHEALKVLCKSGISCSVGIDPIIPGVNDDFDSIKRIVSLAAELVVKHIVPSTYKAKPDNFRPRQNNTSLISFILFELLLSLFNTQQALTLWV